MASEGSKDMDLGVYGANIAAGLTLGLGSPATAIVSGIERLIETKAPSLRCSPYVRVPEVVLTCVSVYSALSTLPVAIHSFAKGHIGEGLIYLASGLLSGAMAVRLGVKLESTYGGGLTGIVGGTIDDTSRVLGDASSGFKKLLK